MVEWAKIHGNWRAMVGGYQLEVFKYDRPGYFAQWLGHVSETKLKARTAAAAKREAIELVAAWLEEVGNAIKGVRHGG